MWLLDLLSCLVELVMLLLWPERAENRRVRHETEHRSGPLSKWEILFVVFFLSAIVVLFLLVLWKWSRLQ